MKLRVLGTLQDKAYNQLGATQVQPQEDLLHSPHHDCVRGVCCCDGGR